MKIKTIGDLMELREILKMCFGDVPENIYVESPEIFDFGKKELGLTDEQVSSEIECYGIKVERELTKVY